jgi:hypothetical protein
LLQPYFKCHKVGHDDSCEPAVPQLGQDILMMVASSCKA